MNSPKFYISFLFIFLGFYFHANAQTVVVMNASGTFTVPAGVTSLTVQSWGTGGSGGGVTASLSSRGGGGGGGGAYNAAILSVSPGQTYTVTIGALGATGTGNGGAGGATIFTGVGGTVTANGGSGGVSNNGAGGAGGVGNFNGGSGGTGNASNGAGGGGAAGSNANGGNGATASAGIGGAGLPNIAPYKGGNGAANKTGTGTGNSGVSPGGGGGGGRATLLSTANGGVGALGQVVITYSLPLCSGTPNPGNTISSANNVCSGVNFTLSLQNAIPGGGITYQWQRADDLLFTLNLTNLGTASTQVTNLTSSKYYRCQVTCASGPSTGTSVPVLVTLNPNVCNCVTYCTPTYANGTGSGDYISQVTIAGTTLNSLSAGAASPYYTLFPSSGITTGTLVIGSNYTMTVKGGTFGTCYIRAWIDYNNDGVFSAIESVGISPNVGNLTPGAITFTVSGTVGTHRLRLRSSDTSPGPGTGDFCGATNSGYGETEDYCVDIVNPSPPIISNFNPASGCANAVLVNITGSNFTGVTGVQFGGINAASYTVVSPTQITATPSGNANGIISVSNLAGTGTSAGNFTILPQPSISVSPGNSNVCTGSSIQQTASGSGAAPVYTWSPGALVGAIQNLSPQATTTYTVTSTDGTCSATTTFVLTALNSPTVNTISSAPSSICPGATTSLTATSSYITGGAGPGAYIVTSIPFLPQIPIGIPSPGPSGDDVVSGTYSIGFPFTFYGNTYTNFVISTNGFLSFDASPGAGCCAGQLLPNALAPNNLIALGWSDLNTAYGGTIDYFNLSNPNRLVVRFNAVAEHLNAAGTVTSQAIIYQTGDIEIHTSNISGFTVGRILTQGIENAGGIIASNTPGWNAVSNSPTLTNQAFKFSQYVVNPVNNYSWSPIVAGVIANPSQQTTNANPANSTTYTVTATAGNGCTATSTVNTTVFPIVSGSASVSPTPLCLGGSATFSGSVPTTCPGGLFLGFAGGYAPANWTLSQVNSNGVLNILGAPLSISITGGTNGSGTPGSTNFSYTFECAGNVSFDWGYTHPDLFGSVFEQPRYTINGGAAINMNGFVPGGPNNQNGTQTIAVNAGDVVQIQAYTIDNDPNTCTVVISNFTAPNPPTNGTVSFWDAAIGGNNLGASPVSYTPIVAGSTTYYAQYTAAGSGCINPVRDPVVLTTLGLPVVAATANPDIICVGASSSLSGTGALTYSWNPGALVGNPTVTPLATTTYSVIGTDASGCTGSSIVTVTVNPLPTVTASASLNTICFGGSSVLTGGGANTYLWNPGALVGSPTVTPASTTTYTVTGTSAAGCTGTTTVTVTVNPNPTITASASPAAICEGASSVLTGVGGATYAWNPGALIGSPTVSPIVTTIYSVVGTDANGCTGSSIATVTVNPLPGVPVATSSPSSICAGGTSVLSASNISLVNVTPFTESFANNAQGWTLGTEWGIGSATVSAGQNYNGPDPGVDHTPSGDNGVAGVVIGGNATTTPHAAYYLTSPVINLTGLTTANLNFWRWLNSDYTPYMTNTVDVFNGATWVNVYSSGGAPGVNDVAWNLQTYNVTPHINAAFQVRFGVATGSGAFTVSSWNIDDVSITGTVPATVAWTGPAVIANPALATTNVTPGTTGVLTYTVTVTGAGGCSSSNTTTLTVNTLPVVTASASPSTICVGGSSVLTGSGAATYAWNPGALVGSPTVSPVATTTYSVVGTDGNGCTGTATVDVTVNPNPVVTASASPSAICLGGSSVLTGTGAATYDWNPGALVGSPTVSPAAATTYSLVGTDANGCTGTATVDVTVNPNPVITASASPATICEGLSSVLTGSGAATYAWNPGALVGSPTVTPLVTTTYSVTGTDGNGCTGTTDVTVTVNSTPIVTASASPSAICPGGSSVLTGTGAATYAWNPGALIGSPTVSPVATTTYSLVGTDANGCTGTATVDVTVNPNPVITASASPATICEGLSSVLTGSGAAIYAWNPGALVGMPSVTPLVTTTYTVTGTDGNGCTGTTDVTVTVNPAPIVSATATPATTCNLTVVTPVATGAPTINWTGGVTNNVPFVATSTTTYTVTGTDGLGCDGTTTVLVTVNPMSGTLAPTTTNQSQDQGDDFNVNYYDASCDLIATVDDGAGGNILGLTTSAVNVDATAGFHNGQPFVRRWYQIIPTSNGAADVILYINQSDFNDYNAAVLAPYLPLPTSGNNADPNIANIRITKNTDAGLGNSPIVITPTVNWNGTYWELSFNTPSFSQFRVHSVNPGNVPLPATVTNFSGMKLETSDKLSWTTSSEQNNAYFNLQHSTDGTNFSTIAKVNSKAPNGNSAATINYTSINAEPKLGHNYYRLQQVDLDNKTSVHAQIVDLIWGANGNTVSIYPNPTTDILNIDLYAQTAQNTTVKLLDMSGRVIKQIQAKSAVGMNNIKLSMGEIASGVYTVQVYENNTLSHTSKVKKSN
jgi:hypothetical protein